MQCWKNLALRLLLGYLGLDGFLKQACVAGHPGLRDMGVHLNLRTLQGGMLNGRIYR